MMSPQIISSLFDLVREVFNSNNRKRKTKWLGKLIIAILILTISTCFAAIGILTKELYSTQQTLKSKKAEVERLKEVEHEVLVLRETNKILSDILQKRIPGKEVVIKKDGKVISKIPE